VTFHQSKYAKREDEFIVVSCSIQDFVAEFMREDLSGLNVPAWAKIFREYEEAIILLLLVLGIFLTESARREENFLKRNPAYRR
jgi:hypothetical protein